MNIDVPNGFWGAEGMADETSDTVALRMKMLGYTNSAEENAIWEDLANIDTISTVKSLQLAQSRGVDVLQITAANWATYQNDPTFTIGSDDKSKIGAFVNDQRYNVSATVFTPKTNTNLGNWAGVGYVAVGISQSGQTTTYDMRYIISGGYNGGAGNHLRRLYHHEPEPRLPH